MTDITTKFTLWAPRTPGSHPEPVAFCDTIEEALDIAAARFDHRKDLRWQDVVVRLGRDGRIIERCGPFR